MTLNEILTLVFSAGSLLVSTVTLGVGWAAYKKFLSQKLAESQLNVVLEFVEAIYNSPFHLATVRRREHTISATYSNENLFQLSTGNTKPYTGLHHDLPVLALSSQLAKFQGWKFITNPLLPNAISKELYALSKYFHLSTAKPDDIDHCIVIGEQTADTVFWNQAEDGYSGFIERCSALDFAIKTWLKKHGLHDLNQHVVNTSPFGDYTRQKYYYIDKNEFDVLQKIKDDIANQAKEKDMAGNQQSERAAQ